MNKKQKNIALLAVFIIFVIGLVFVIRFFNLNNFSDDNGDSSLSHSYKAETKYDNIKVFTNEEIKNDKRSLLHIAYPVTESESVNNSLKSFTQEFINEYEEVSKTQEKNYQDYLVLNGEEAVSSVTEYTQHFDISFANDKYLLIVFHRYRFTGGTGSDDAISLLFNRETGQELPLSSLFVDDSYLEILSEKSRDLLNKKMLENLKLVSFQNKKAKDDWLEMTVEHVLSGTEATKENFDSLSISNDNELIISFDKYQVGPGSDGVVELKMPLEELSQVLAPDVLEIFDIEKSKKKDKEEKKDKINSADITAVDCAKEKCVALTFDDGPSVYTDELLDILKENNVKASFFILGKSAKIQPDTISRIVREGHVLGNHTWNHKNLSKLGDDGVEQQLSDTDDLIKEISGYEMTLLRPPYGAYNEELFGKTDKAVILWNVDPEDWKDRDTELVTERMSLAEAGSIILAHDIYPSTIAAIPEVIYNLKQKDLKFVTVDKLFSEEALNSNKALRYQQGL